MSSDRFLTFDQAADERNISHAQLRALLRRKDLRGLKNRGRGIWWIERAELEAFIERTFTETEDYLDRHPFTEGDQGDEDQ